jgi:hypothetical protein
LAQFVFPIVSPQIVFEEDLTLIILLSLSIKDSIDPLISVLLKHCFLSFPQSNSIKQKMKVIGYQKKLPMASYFSLQTQNF